MTDNSNSNNGKKPSSRFKVPNINNGVNAAKSAFNEMTGQSVTPLEFGRQKQQIENQTNYQILRQDRAKLSQETEKANTEELRVELFQAQHKELGYKVDAAWLKVDIAEIGYQTTSVEKQIASVAKDVKEIELGIAKDNRSLLEEKKELNYLKGLEDLRELSLSLTESTYDNDVKESVLEVNAVEITQNKIPTKAEIKAYLIGD